MSGKQGGWKERLTESQKELIVKLFDTKEFSHRAIAEMAGCTRGGVKSTLCKAGRMNFFSLETAEKVMSLVNAGLSAKDIERETGVPETTVYTVTHYHKELSVLSPAKNPIDGIIADRRRICREWGPGRYIVVADFHILFHKQEIIQQILSAPGDFDGCIIAGDYIDEYWISFFRKEGPRITHSTEVAAGIRIVELLKKRFGRVLMIQGNHEDRRYKQLLEATKGVADLMEEQSPEVYRAVNDARNWYFNKIPNITVHNSWWVDICNGRIIVCHPDKFMKVPGQAPAGVLEHFMGHAKAYQLNMPIDSVHMGHTHRMSGPTHRLGVWTAELPCCCGILPYQVNSKAGNAGTVDTGFYVLTTHKDGTLWFNESRCYLLEEDPKLAKKYEERGLESIRSLAQAMLL